MIQPPRGFGENPVAIYHDPELAPSHHYLAAYRWLQAPQEQNGFGAHAVVHLGKHGSMEWLPGKNAALAATCATDRSEEHTSELQSLMRISYAVFCLQNKTYNI